MFRALLSLIIWSILTVITASGFIHVCRCRLLSAADNDTREIKPESIITVKMLQIMSDKSA